MERPAGVRCRSNDEIVAQRSRLHGFRSGVWSKHLIYIVPLSWNDRRQARKGSRCREKKVPRMAAVARRIALNGRPCAIAGCARRTERLWGKTQTGRLEIRPWCDKISVTPVRTLAWAWRGPEMARSRFFPGEVKTVAGGGLRASRVQSPKTQSRKANDQGNNLERGAS